MRQYKSYVYFGNEFDPSLNMGNNFDKSFKKSAERLKLLSKMSDYLIENACFKVFQSMIQSLITYCLTLKCNPTSTQLNKLKY